MGSGHGGGTSTGCIRATWGLALRCGTGCTGGCAVWMCGGGAHGTGSGQGAGSTCQLQPGGTRPGPAVWQMVRGGGGAGSPTGSGHGGHAPLRSHGYSCQALPAPAALTATCGHAALNLHIPQPQLVGAPHVGRTWQGTQPCGGGFEGREGPQGAARAGGKEVRAAPTKYSSRLRGTSHMHAPHAAPHSHVPSPSTKTRSHVLQGAERGVPMKPADW